MAKKKLLQDSEGQIWPITVADCVYLSDGSKTVKKYIDDALAGKANTHSHNYLPSAGGTVTGEVTLKYTSGPRLKVNNNTNTIWFGINTSGDRWGLYDETNAKYLVESDGTNIKLNGNASTATKLATARTITIGNKSNTFNGSADITYSLNDIGALSKQSKSAATAATAGWYRIATSVAGINRNMAMFEIDATVSGRHSETILAAGICYGQAPTLNQLAHTEHSNTGISKARIVYHTTYSGNYAYLEVYVPTATATTLNVKMIEGFGWSLTTPSTAGSVPSGYTNKEITLVKNKIVADFKGTGEFSSLAMSGSITLNNNNVIRSKTPAEYTNTNTSAAVAAGTTVNLLQYNNSGNLHLGSGLYDNYLNTGSTYINSPNNLLYRTRNTGYHQFQINGTAVVNIKSTEVEAAKNVYAKAGVKTGGNITTTGTGTHNIGSTDNTFGSIIGKNVYSYLGGTHYASLRMITEGTTSTQGVGRLVAGNNINAGTAGNAKGQVLLYGTNTGYTTITPGYNSTSSITLTLPSAAGTLISDNQATFTAMPKFNMNNRNGSIFEIFGGDSNGHGVRFGGGGATFIGSGESAANIITAESTSATDEQLYVTSDNNIYFYTKCGTIADRRKATLNGSLNFYPDKALGGSIGHADYPWLQMFADTYHVYGAAGKTYGHLNVQTVGTTSAVGETRLVLGNSTAEGTADNAWGRICLYTKSAGYTYIQPGTNTSGITITLPSATGKIPLMITDADEYWGLLPPSGSTDTWIRSGESGFLPYEKGGNSSSLGTASWTWKNIYGVNLNATGTDTKTYARLYVNTYGTADAKGVGMALLGNNIAEGTAGNAYGYIRMYGSGKGYTNIKPGYNNDDSITLTLPSSGGTIARTADINNKVADYLPLAGGTMTGKITTPNNAAGITIGDDVTICDRNVANFMVLEGSTATSGGIIFGSGKDTNIYRGGENVLKTDDAFHAVSVTVSDRYYMSSSVGQSQLGVGDTDCYWYNKQANKYFQFKNDGRICLSDNELYHRGHNIIDVADRSSGDSGFGNSNRPCGFIGRFPGWSSSCLYINTYSNSGAESKSYNDVKIKGNNVYIDGAMRCSSCYISNRRITIADSAPSSPATGDIWIDT